MEYPPQGKGIATALYSSNLKLYEYDANTLSLENLAGGTRKNLRVGELNATSLVAPTGRGASYVIAAADAPTYVKNQADAICDGFADDVQIQAALNADYLDIYLTQGTYNTAALLRFHTSYQKLRGAGRTATYVSLTNGSNCNMIAGNGATTLTQCTISDMQLYGNKAGNASGHGIVIDGLTNLHLTDLVVVDAKNDGINTTAAYGSNSSPVFSRLYVAGCAGNGVWLENCYGVTINYLWLLLNDNAGFHLQGGEAQITNVVSDRNAANPISANYFSFDLSSANRVMLTNIYVDQGDGGESKNYTMRITSCTGVDITNLTIDAGSVAVEHRAIYIVSCTGVHITNYEILDAVNFGSRYGIYAIDMHHSTFSNGYFQCNGNAGTIGIFEHTDCSDNIFSDNDLTHASIPAQINGVNSLVSENRGYIKRGEIRTASGSLVPTGVMTATTVTGTFTESPLTLKPGANTMHCTASGTVNVVAPAGTTIVVTSVGGGATVTDSPKTCPAGATTLITVAAGGTNAFTLTVHHNAIAWHNPELQDIFIKKIVINRTAAGGTATAEMNVGIADNGTVDDPGIEFFDSILVNNAAAIHDSYVAGGTSYGTQTIWVPCQDSASATGGWIVGKVDTEIANALAGSFHIEYCGQ